MVCKRSILQNAMNEQFTVIENPMQATVKDDEKSRRDLI